MSRFVVISFASIARTLNGIRLKQLRGGEITRLGGDFDSILVASLPGGEMTSYQLNAPFVT